MASEKSVFISYPRAEDDTALAHALANALRLRGYSPWVDKYDPKERENWKDAIHQAMSKAQAAVFLIDGSLPIPDRHQEYEWRAAVGASADGKQRPMIPLLLHGAKRPGFLSDRIAIEARDKSEWEKVADQLVPLLDSTDGARDEAGYQAARAEMERRLNDIDRFIAALEQEALQDTRDQKDQRR